MSFDKFDLFCWSRALEIYASFAGFHPVRIELLTDSTLLSFSKRDACITTVVQSFVMQETSGDYRQE